MFRATRGCFGHRLLPPCILAATAGRWLQGQWMVNCGSDDDNQRRFIDTWTEKSSLWQNKFLLDPSKPSLGSWIDRNGTESAIGCKACFAHGFKTAWGQYLVNSPSMLQPYCFHRHSDSLSHTVAVQKFIRRRFSEVDVAIDALSPSADEFEKLIDDTCSARLGQVGRKTKQKLWCLQEGLKALDQTALSQAAAVFLFRDERHSRLLVRFRCVDQNLTCKSGVLGQERDFGTGARELLKATGNIIVRACTRFHGAPPPSDGTSTRQVAKPFLKKKLLKHVRKIVIGITVDSASDERLCCEMMRDPNLANMRAALTPNLRYVNLDKAHATRRLISRPWGVDDYIKDVVLMFARGRGSVARLIQNSRENRRLFAKFARARQMHNIGLHTVVANFRAAGHRFESYQKPLGRSCLFIISAIQFANHLALHRSDEHGKLATTWCLWVDSEKCLQAAMLADASDQLMSLTRVVDDENVDPAVANREVYMFVKAIDLWFGEPQQCLHLFGYTSTMLKTLSHRSVWHVNGRVCSIGQDGGLPASIINRCLDRMQSWVILAKAAVSSEFPYFELSQAFNAFDVTQGSPSANARHCLARIAQSEGLPELELTRQWEDVYPRAAVAAAGRSTRTVNKDAWLRAITDINRTPATSRAHPTNVIMKALTTWRVFGISSSGVEQNFSKNSWSFGDRRQSAHAGTEEMHIKLSLDLAQHDRATLIEKARQIWSFCYGPPRTHNGPARIDKCLKRKVAGEITGVPTSEIAFTRKRRRATQDALLAAGEAGVAMDSLGKPNPAEAPLPSSWTDKHEAELKFQHAKERRRKVDAAADNLLLSGDGDVAALRAEASELRLDQVCSERARLARAKRITAALTGQSLASLLLAIRHKSAYVSNDCGDRATMVTALRAAGLVQCNDMSQADVFVVQSPGRAPAGATLVSALRGGYQISPGLLLSAHGHAVKFKPSMLQPRILFASLRFAHVHREFCQLVKQVLASAAPADCKMKLQFSRTDESRPDSEWQALAHKFKTRPAQLLGLVLQSELTKPAFADWKHSYTVTQIVKHLKVVDSARSLTNLFVA